MKSNPIVMSVDIKHPVKASRLVDLLCCALEGGSNYWCDYSAEYSRVDSEICALYDVMHDNYLLTVKDTFTGKEYSVTLGRMKLGLADMARKFPKHSSNFINENEDAETGDVFLQCCIFGDLIYG